MKKIKIKKPYLVGNKYRLWVDDPKTLVSCTDPG